MKDLSSRQTFLIKYLMTVLWIVVPIVLAIHVYNKFGQVEGFYIIPFSFLPAFVSYLPMKISFDDSRIVVSDLFTKTEFRFSDIKSLDYSRSIISYHPYRELLITTNDGRIKKVKFSPRRSAIFQAFRKMGVQGRDQELIAAWKTHNRQHKR